MVVLNKINNYVVISKHNRRVLKAFQTMEQAEQYKNNSNVESFIHCLKVEV